MNYRLACTFFFLGIALAACSSRQVEPDEADLLVTAAAEATQIMQRAQATALVMDARRQATAMLAESTSQNAITLAPTGESAILPVHSPGSQITPTPGEQSSPSTTPQGSNVELLGVGIGAEGNFIEVYFRAPPAVAGEWYQGVVSVTDEATGAVYIEIPVMPVIGPLFGKPVENGQIGYVMLVNAPVPLRLGSTVTVTLGEYIFEHIVVK